MIHNKFFQLLLVISCFVSNLFTAELIIGNIAFRGNYLINDQELRSVIFSAAGDKLDQTRLNSDLERIAAYYEKKNIFNVKVFDPELEISDPQAVGIIFILEEDPEISINQVVFTGNRYLSSSIIEDVIDRGSKDLAGLSSLLNDIIDLYGRNGFLFTRVTLDSLHQNENSTDAFIRIDEKSPFHLEKFHFRGNEVTRENTLLRISQLNHTIVITPEIIRTAEQRLNTRSYLRNSRIIPLNESEILISVEEERMSSFAGILGYVNSENSSDRLSGFIDLTFNTITTVAEN